MENVQNKIEVGKNVGVKIAGWLFIGFTVVILAVSLATAVFGEGVSSKDYIKSQHEQIQNQRIQLDEKETALCEEAKKTGDNILIGLLQESEADRELITQWNDIIKEGNCDKIFDKLFQMADSQPQ